MPPTATSAGTFFGWRVTGGAFVLAVFGWGLGFYGPPVFLGVLHEIRGWSLGLISAAITLHYLVGAALAARLPALHARFGLAQFTQLGALALALGLLGWSLAAEPWQLFVAAAVSGAGWSATSAAASRLAPEVSHRRASRNVARTVEVSMSAWITLTISTAPAHAASKRG